MAIQTTCRCFSEMCDDRSSVRENNEKKFWKKNSEDNEESGVIAVEVANRPRESCDSLERNTFETAERTLVSTQRFCRFCRDIPDDLIDGTKRDFPSIKNSGNFRVLQLKRSKDDNPDDAQRNHHSTYSGEPIHHQRNVHGDRKSDKFILAEVVEDTGTRSQNTLKYQDQVNCDRGNDDNRYQQFTSSITMDKSPKSFSNDAQQLVDETSATLAIDKGQQDHSSCDLPEVEAPLKFRGSPELRRKFSRTDAVRDDARKLKTATLDRMGKMFKLKPTQASGKELHEESANSEAPKDSYGDQQSRKDKTNSLGRMFKLVDKNGEPRKLLPHSRTGSLSHILRRKSTGAEEDDSTGNRNNRSVFSRLLSQWKNRSGSGNATAEPNLRASIAEEDKSSSAKPVTTSRIILSSTCTNPLQVPSSPTQMSSLENSGDVEYPA